MSGVITFKKAQWLVHQGREGQVIRTPSLTEVMLRDRNGDLFTAPIHELRALADVTASAGQLQDTVRATDSDRALAARKEAEFRLEVISPLLGLGPARTRQAVTARAAEHHCSPATVYRWISQFEAVGDLSGLTRKVRKDDGQRRLQEGVELLMETLIDSEYLTDQRPPMSSVYIRLKLAIDRANSTRAAGAPELAVPDFQTFRRRIYGVEERRRVSRRFGSRALNTMLPILGEYPGAVFPLAVLQVDHTPLDIQLVDSVHRLPLGRAWITLIMDVFSRVVMGFHISLDPPGAFSTGQAMTHAILPKESWLARHREAVSRLILQLEPGQELPELTWPCWGKPVKLKADNAREFWGGMLERACAQYHIDQEFRPVLKPQYGAHIERLLETVLMELHTLPGTTFSNSGQRGDYDSEGRAMMTIDALEVWLSAFILGVYHRRVHSELGVTPLQRWEQGLLEGTELHPPTGLPERIMGDRAERLRMDFLPFFEATVQRAGVRHENLTYSSEVLHQYIKARDPARPGTARSFVFRYDPRDISVIYFLDPQLDRYFPVRCRQPNFPSISVWELREAKKFAAGQKLEATDERSLMAAYRLMHVLAHAEQTRTSEARAERKDAKRVRRTDEKKLQRDKDLPGLRPTAKSSTRSALSLFGGNEEVQPFDDIEI